MPDRRAAEDGSLVPGSQLVAVRVRRPIVPAKSARRLEWRSVDGAVEQTRIALCQIVALGWPVSRLEMTQRRRLAPGMVWSVVERVWRHVEVLNFAVFQGRRLRIGTWRRAQRNHSLDGCQMGSPPRRAADIPEEVCCCSGGRETVANEREEVRYVHAVA